MAQQMKNEAEVAAADDATHQLLLELDHRVPRHRHHIDFALECSGERL